MPDADPPTLPLIAEATKKSGLIWVTVPGRRASPVWHVWHDGAAYLLTGGREQDLPGLHGARRAAVLVRSKDKQGGRVAHWVAEVRHLEPHSPQWQDVVPVLHAKRLNSPDGEAAPQRWAEECLLTKLTPTGQLLADDEGSFAAPPPATPATSPTVLPWTVSRWLRSRRR